MLSPQPCQEQSKQSGDAQPLFPWLAETLEILVAGFCSSITLTFTLATEDEAKASKAVSALDLSAGHSVDLDCG
jgi:hypothetical protein